ncbi:General amino acid permease AGP2 [Penicillium macrosclerotiorum]|uniref:General amino acid permease AGP2 n=1 Tax=Penicillium macrosclerotiorum TaxID=303699 RepID=UPI0025487CE9|nr:General amino acid permease AGP2 [Penicillium macrosclerotiorum]KAJ5689858.1 General amino acid permease AGP2 [Penicillium macrosclerotiorum]
MSSAHKKDEGTVTGVLDTLGLKPEGGPHDVQEGMMADNADNLQRHLGNRQIQLIAIGGSIGTALFVSIGTGLYHGGPGSLFLAFAVQSIFLAMVNNCLAEMTTAFPVSGGFIRLAGKWVDDALGFMVGWNFFFYEALLIPFEISAFTLVLSFWSPTVSEPGPVAGICAGIIICYASLNILAVRAYGEAEFWLSGGKVILIFSLFFFTFITMVGGNPHHDAYGFRFWNNPGSFMEYLDTGALGRFEGFLGSLWSACFAVVGPEYISMVAAEAKRPRIYIKSAFKTVYARFGIFFIGGALAVGIVCSARDPDLEKIVMGDSSDSSSAAASPYVIGMSNLGIKIFPSIVNALLLTSIFSAGNTYTYCAIRTLYGLALEGRAPRILTYTTRKGVPIYCFAIVMIFPILSFLQVSNSSSIVITWFANLVTAGGLINYITITLTYICFHRACKAQGIDRRSFSYFGRLQPFCGYAALVWMILVTILYGYPSYKPWSVSTFWSDYTMQIVIPPLYLIWKFIKRTKIVKPHEADLVWERPLIDAYEASFTSPPVGFWREIGQMFGFRRIKGGNDKRRDSVAPDFNGMAEGVTV